MGTAKPNKAVNMARCNIVAVGSVAVLLFLLLFIIIIIIFRCATRMSSRRRDTYVDLASYSPQCDRCETTPLRAEGTTECAFCARAKLMQLYDTPSSTRGMQEHKYI